MDIMVDLVLVDKLDMVDIVEVVDIHNYDSRTYQI